MAHGWGLRPAGKRVTFYSCGPTAYESANLSLCRRFIVSDLITRILQSKGMQVDAYMNFTDIDDNTINNHKTIFCDM